MKKITLFLEGNIGAGKSTLLKILGDNIPAIEPVLEPTDKWQKINEKENLLDLFYKDTKRWAYTFQSYAFISRIQTQNESCLRSGSKNIQILERSVFCDRFCFAKNCYESGLMTSLEWNIYTQWFSWLAENYAAKPSGFIYLKTNPQMCLERIKKRARSEEGSIPLDYLNSLHNKHEAWLIQKMDIPQYLHETPTLILDASKNFEKEGEEQEDAVSKVKSFIAEIEANQVVSMKQKTPQQISL